MNDVAHGWVTTALSLPIPAYAAILSALVGLALPWLVEANVPMEEWGAGRFRLTTYGVAAIAGLVAGITVWHSLSALSLWAPALAINCARDIASHFLPWLSPRKQVILRRDEQGQVVGIKEGDDTTILIRSDSTQSKP